MTTRVNACEEYNARCGVWYGSRQLFGRDWDRPNEEREIQRESDKTGMKVRGGSGSWRNGKYQAMCGK